MPGPLDLLKRGFNFATTPLVDEESIRPAQDMIDPGPSMDRSPMEARMRGFGAGALEGLRGLTTPLDLATVGLPMAGRAMSGLKGMMGAGRMVDAAPKMAPTMQTLGEQVAEFTPVGSEALYNAGREATRPGSGMEGIYNLLMKRFGGRGQ